MNLKREFPTRVKLMEKENQIKCTKRSLESSKQILLSPISREVQLEITHPTWFAVAFTGRSKWVPRKDLWSDCATKGQCCAMQVDPKRSANEAWESKKCLVSHKTSTRRRRPGFHTRPLQGFLLNAENFVYNSQKLQESFNYSKVKTWPQFLFFFTKITAKSLDIGLKLISFFQIHRSSTERYKRCCYQSSHRRLNGRNTQSNTESWQKHSNQYLLCVAYSSIF